ncbi:MAG: deoxyribonuclease IV, partial [Deferribacteres bacterium]|nr:deoxyribonuclease IV [Deferribacteres bacterium]
FGSRVDRHWHIGYGRIGMRGFEVLLSHPKIRSLPLVMETPWGEGWDRRNLETVKGLLGDES